MNPKSISIVIPVHNEEESIKPLYSEIKRVMVSLIRGRKIKDYEVIFINDGSTDKTQQRLEYLKKSERNLRIIEFRKNFGQTSSLRAGFDNASGDLIITMDGDLQNDPKDIPKLIDKLEEGYDVVSGWRYKRKDKFGKRLSSYIINRIRKKLIGDNLHDYGCSLKIYKRDIIKDLELFGELHRYITGYLYIKGYKIGEIKVNHRERKSGKTKYKFNRGINGILDLFFLKFWSDYSARPLHFFGRLGIIQWIIAFLIVLEQLIFEPILGRDVTLGPLFLLASMLIITGLLFIIFGFLSEIITRLYFTNKRIYRIKKIL